MDLHHPILREFPEHREIIRRLKGSDDHFRKMFDEYHRLDDSIYRIEEEIDFATDQEIEALKMRRAKLKDNIYHLIRPAPTPCPVCEGTGVARLASQGGLWEPGCWWTRVVSRKETGTARPRAIG